MSTARSVAAAASSEEDFIADTSTTARAQDAAAIAPPKRRKLNHGAATAVCTDGTTTWNASAELEHRAAPDRVPSAPASPSLRISSQSDAHPLEARSDAHFSRTFPPYLLLALSDHFLSDLDAVHLARSAHCFLAALQRYSIKHTFSPAQAAQWRQERQGRVGLVRKVDANHRLSQQCRDTLLLDLPSSVQRIEFVEGLMCLPLSQLQSLPSSLTALCLNMTRGPGWWQVEVESSESIGQWRLPPSLVEFHLPQFWNRYECDDYPLAGLQLPASITSLGVPKSDLSWQLKLPDSLLILSYGGCSHQSGGSQETQQLQLPEGLLTLHMTQQARSPLPHLPSTLTELIFDERSCFDCPLDNIANTGWPKGLTTLTLPKAFNKPLQHLLLPPALTSLQLWGLDYDHPLEELRLPPTLTAFSCDISHPLTNLQLPDTLKSLKLGSHHYRNARAYLPRRMPASLTHLEVGACGFDDLDLPVLPCLTSVVILMSFPLLLLPRIQRALQTVTDLQLDIQDTLSVRLVQLPPTLRRLTLGPDEQLDGLICPLIDGVTWPTSLEELEIRWGQVEIRRWTPPPSLTVFKLNNPEPVELGVEGERKLLSLGSTMGPLLRAAPPAPRSRMIGSSLRTLSIQANRLDLGTFLWPLHSLEHLTLSCEVMRDSYSNWTIPPSVTALDLCITHTRDLLPIQYPPGLRTLILECMQVQVSPHTIVQSLPPQLETLMLYLAPPPSNQCRWGKLPQPATDSPSASTVEPMIDLQSATHSEGTRAGPHAHASSAIAYSDVKFPPTLRCLWLPSPTSLYMHGWCCFIEPHSNLCVRFGEQEREGLAKLRG